MRKPFRATQINVTHPLARGLKACWLFNANSGTKAWDYSMNGHHGTLTNMPNSAWQKGGLYFAGAGGNDYVDVPDHQHWDDIGPKGSIVALVNPDTIPGAGTYPYIISRRSGATTLWSFLLDGDKAGALEFNGGGGFIQLNGDVPTAGKIQHVAITWDSLPNGAKMYQDGIITDFNNGNPVATGSIPIAIGNRTSGGRDWNGLIYYTMIYDRPLFQSEIISLQRSAKQAFELPDTRYFDITAGGATTIQDLIGSGIIPFLR